MAYGAVSVGNTATKIINNNCGRQALMLVNNSSDTIVYLGTDSSVTTTTGLPLFYYSTRDFTKTFGYYNGDIYGITASGTADIRYWEVVI